MRRLAVVVAALALGSCQLGTRQEKFAPARSGAGVEVRLFSFERTELRGELLEVRDSSLLILLATGRFAVAPYARVRQAMLTGLGQDYYYSSGGMRDVAGWQAHARRVARYPQGLTSEQLPRLLAAAGQTALDTVP